MLCFVAKCFVYCHATHKEEKIQSKCYIIMHIVLLYTMHVSEINQFNLGGAIQNQYKINTKCKSSLEVH